MTPSSDPVKGPLPMSRGIGAALLLGTQLAAAMALFAGGGYWIDHRRGGGITWTVTGMFIGLAYSFYEVWRIVRLINSEKPPEPGKPSK